MRSDLILPELDLPQLHNTDDPIFKPKHFAGQDRMAEERFIVFLPELETTALENGEKTHIKNLIERLRLNRHCRNLYNVPRF